MTENELQDLLLQEKPNRLLRQIAHGESYASQLAKEIETTYAHTIKLINRLIDLDLIEARKHGRKKLLNLNEDGKKLAEASSQYAQVIEEVNSQ